MACNVSTLSFTVRFKSGLWFIPFLLAAAVSACGSSSTSGSTDPAMSGQIFIESHPGGAAQFSTPSGVTVEHWMNGQLLESTSTDTYGRFQFENTMTMTNCQIRIADSSRSIASTYDLDMTGRDEVSVYCMVYDSGGQSYAWAHEFSGRWSEMPSNFDATMDADDMRNFWQEGSHSWLGSFGGRTMYMM